MTQRYAVEFDRRTVGVAVRFSGGFMFYSSDDRFQEMDGRMFPRARAIERHLKRMSERLKPSTGAHVAGRRRANFQATIRSMK